VSLVGLLVKYVTVSAKIPVELKDMLDRLGIKPGSVIRRALEEEVRRAMFKRLEERARKLSKKLPEIPDEEIAEIIREYRER